METQILQLFDSPIQTEDGDIYIKPLCDFFKIDTENQVLKIKSDPILQNCYGKISNKLLFLGRIKRIIYDEKKINEWKGIYGGSYKLPSCYPIV